MLEDKAIYKVGVAPADDAKYIFEDYSVIVNSSLDVRHLAQLRGHTAGGLASLSKSLLHIVLDKSWKVLYTININYVTSLFVSYFVGFLLYN